MKGSALNTDRRVTLVREFESHSPRQKNAFVAQLEEHSTFNTRVAGSIPAGRTISKQFKQTERYHSQKERQKDPLSYIGCETLTV